MSATRLRAALSVAALAAATAGTPQRALAAESQSPAAEVLFEQARELMASGRYREACPKLAESQRLDAGIGTLLNLGDCYEHNGQLASAWATFGEAASAARASRQPDREAIARERVAALKPRLTTLTIEPAQRDRLGLQVARDGVVVSVALWSVAVPVDAGAHAIEATAKGRVPWHTTLVVGTMPGDTTVVIPRLQSPPAVWHAREAGLALGGAGVLGLVIGGVYGAAAIRNRDASRAHCGDTSVCDQQGVDLRAQGLRAAGVSTAAFITGAALFAGGVTLFALAPQYSHPPASASLWVGVASVSLGGRF